MFQHNLVFIFIQPWRRQASMLTTSSLNSTTIIVTLVIKRHSLQHWTNGCILRNQIMGLWSLLGCQLMLQPLVTPFNIGHPKNYKSFMRFVSFMSSFIYVYWGSSLAKESIIVFWSGGGGGGWEGRSTLRKNWWACEACFQNPLLVFMTKICDFPRPYLWPDQKFDTLLMTVAADRVAPNITFEGLLFMVLSIMMEK